MTLTHFEYSIYGESIFAFNNGNYEIILGLLWGNPCGLRRLEVKFTFTVLIKFIYNMIFILLVCIIRESVLVNPYRIVLFLI